MYQALIVSHSIVRWLVLISLVIAIYRAYRGYRSNAIFSKADNAVRHWTATFAHVQLVIGMILYFRSPAAGYFRAHFSEAVQSPDAAFFGLVHPVLMLVAVVIITIGSAVARRSPSDNARFKVMLGWYLAALLIIFIAIPWPFSPLASRPYLR